MTLGVDTDPRQKSRVNEIKFFYVPLTVCKQKITESSYANVALLAQLV
jgi:hypothetical protein